MKASTARQTYATIRPSLDQFSNALVDMEVNIPFDTGPSPAPGTDPTGMNTLNSVGQTLFFCIPQNTTLLAYWDTVANRLFNIHNSLNIQGVYQKLPLFDPPIDPALLVRAAAEGLDINAIVTGLNQPLPLVRFQLLVSKATEIFYDGSNTATAKKDSLKLDPSTGLMAGSLVNIALPPVVDPTAPPAAPYTLCCDNNGMTDLWMAITWPK